VRPKSVTGTRTTIDGLRPQVEYSIRIRSRSRAGVSEWSDTISTSTREANSASQAYTDGSGRDSGREARKNMYNLRVILATPRSFLAWTPLSTDRDIVKFRLHFVVEYSK
jgi:hypothetical protein